MVAFPILIRPATLGNRHAPSAEVRMQLPVG